MVLDVSYLALANPPGRPVRFLGRVNLGSYISNIQYMVGKDEDLGWTPPERAGRRSPKEQRNVPVETIIVDHKKLLQEGSPIQIRACNVS